MMLFKSESYWLETTYIRMIYSKYKGTFRDYLCTKHFLILIASIIQPIAPKVNAFLSENHKSWEHILQEL